MALIIQVEDQLHRVLDEFRDTGGAFVRLCLRAARAGTGHWPVLATVDQYSDTRLNRIQQGLLLAELTAVQAQPELLGDAGPVVRQVAEAANRVYTDGGYLNIVGE